MFRVSSPSAREVSYIYLLRESSLSSRNDLEVHAQLNLGLQAAQVSPNCYYIPSQTLSIKIVYGPKFLQVNACIYIYIWGFPKIRGTFLGIPIIRIIVYLGLYWGPLYILRCLGQALTLKSMTLLIGYNHVTSL